MNSQPVIYMVGGPNGAGKTTVAMDILSRSLDCFEYVNADSVAAALSPFKPESVSIEAGRIMLKRIKEIASKGNTFAFESTMASRSFLPFLKECKRKGYLINYLYIWLKSPELSIARVAKRIEAGGHSVPENIIRQRYIRGFSNFFQLYLPIADSWSFYDNSDEYPLLIAEKNLTSKKILYPGIWESITKEFL